MNSALKQAWMPLTFLREASLFGARLSAANLRYAHLNEADLTISNLFGVNLSGADLREADLREADLSETDIEDALSLKDTDLRGVKGLTKEQLASCKAKGAIVVEDPTTSVSQSTAAPPPPEPRNDVQASSAPFARGSVPTSDADGSSATSSKPDSES